MGQIFNRIKRITRSHISDSGSNDRLSDSTIEDSGDGLGRIIDELNDNESNKHFDEPAKGTMTTQRANAVLGTNHNSTADEIKSAYLQKIKEYHPDKVASLGDELKHLAERKTLEINLAYQLLTKV